MLDISSSLHGWHPGYDPVTGGKALPVPSNDIPFTAGGTLQQSLLMGMNPLAFIPLLIPGQRNPHVK